MVSSPGWSRIVSAHRIDRLLVHASVTVNQDFEEQRERMPIMGFYFPPAAEPVVANHQLATYRE